MRKIYYGKAVYNNKEIKAVNKVLKNNRLNLIDGPHVKKLEKIVPKIFGKKYGLMVNSGSSANLLALSSLNFKKGSEITRRKGADRYTLRVIDPTPKKKKTPAEKTFEKRPFKKKGPGEIKPKLRELPGPPKPKKKPFSFRSPSGQDFGKDGVYRRPIIKKKNKKIRA